MSKPIFILNGPNLNMLGVREPQIYGSDTLAAIEQLCADRAVAAGAAIDFRQTNSEGVLVDWVQEAGASASALIVNPAAYTHTSVALLDAVTAIDVPAIEVHLSNIHAREPFRQRSFVSPAVDGVICGLGVFGYALAVDAALRLVDERRT